MASAARTGIHSARTAFRTARVRISAGAKPAAAASPFRFPHQKPFSHRICRFPVEMSSCLESMLPYHSAKASALLTSMLSAVPRTYGRHLKDS